MRRNSWYQATIVANAQKRASIRYHGESAPRYGPFAFVRATLFLLVVFFAFPARGDAPLTGGTAEAPAIGFSNLVVRLDREDIFGIAGGDYRVHILESMRRMGFNAVGAENLVFGKDLPSRPTTSWAAPFRSSSASFRREGG